MDDEPPKVLRSDLKNCEQSYIKCVLAENVPSDRFGAWLTGWYPEEMEYFRNYSNLGIGIGVHHPTDDVILRQTYNYHEALAFFLDRIEIIEDIENVDS